MSRFIVVLQNKRIRIYNSGEALDFFGTGCPTDFYEMDGPALERLLSSCQDSGIDIEDNRIQTLPALSQTIKKGGLRPHEIRI